MHHINLLETPPPTRRWNRTLVQSILTCCLLMVSLIWMIACICQIWAVQSERRRIEVNATKAKLQLADAEEWMEQHRRIALDLVQFDSLRSPVPPEGVLALLTEALPENAGVQKFVLEAAPLRIAPNGTSEMRTPGNSFSRVQAAGLAESDSAVASLIAALSRHPGVTNVQLQESRPRTINHIDCTSFRLAMEAHR